MRWIPGSLLAAACFAACSNETPVEPPPFVPRPADALQIAQPLDATFDDPILLTFTAPRSRARYLVDEGHTLVLDDDGVLQLETDTSGALVVAFAVDGEPVVAAAERSGRPTIVHTASDAVLVTVPLAGELAAELRFAVVTSGVSLLEAVVENAGEGNHDVSLLAFVRRCDGGFTDLQGELGGAAFRHFSPVDALTKILGAGTYVEDLADGLVGEDPRGAVLAAESCGDSAGSDARALFTGTAPGPGDENTIVGIRQDGRLGPGELRPFRVARGVTGLDRASDLPAEIRDAVNVPLTSIIDDGQARLASMPVLEGFPDGAPTREAVLVHRSSYALLDGLMLPAEGLLVHDYYLFSREPTWWFGRLGQHIHESLSMLLLARMDPRSAMESQRNFIDRVEEDGYLPYNIGPVVEQTEARTASAPLFSYVSWEMYRTTQDAVFLAEAYAAGVLLHGFWERERDADHDGLAEWGGIPVTESLRDLENVIWEKVAPPDEVEAVDLNSMLVMEEKSLASMASELGLQQEAEAWRGTAQARASKLNATNWDEATGFYYHVARDAGGFTYEAPDDLKRMEIAGFLPLWAGIVPDARVPLLLARLTDPDKFWRAFGVPGLAADDSFYSPLASRCCRWNGPVWVPWMFLLHRGLIDTGHPELARELTVRTLGAVQPVLARTHQFRELYDPDDATRTNESMPNYCWSSLVALMMEETSAAQR